MDLNQKIPSSSLRMIRKVQSMDSVSSPYYGLDLKVRTGKTTPNTMENKTSLHKMKDNKASRFSSNAHRARFNLAATPESDMHDYDDTLKYRNKMSKGSTHDQNQPRGHSIHTPPAFPSLSPSLSLRHHNISRPASVVSLASLDLQRQESEQHLSMNIAPAGTLPINILTELFSGNVRNLRFGPLLHLVVFGCLLFGTLSDVMFRISAERNARHSYTYGGEDYLGNSSSKIHHGHTSSNDNGKGILGSAMISSITDALSPILPFAGGVDLRRDDAWKSWRSYLWIFGDSATSLSSRNGTTMMKGTKVPLVPRGGGQSSRKRKNSSTAMVLSAVTPFLSTDEIAEMTLRDVSFTFQYIMEAGREGFKINSFFKRDFEGEPLNDRMRKAVHSIEDAVGRSRGKDASPSLMSDQGFGDIDALRFCAAMRILAEWRLIRQVPPGYKSYAVGMSLGQKDVVQNVGKIEHAAHQWMEAKSTEVEGTADDCGDEQGCLKRRSPTLRELLLYEIECDTHPNNKLPRLKDQTAAMGLLWVRRQLQYQTATFERIITVPKVYRTAIDAVVAAYQEVYGNFHGWAVQKIFNYSFQSAPNVEEVFRHMNPHRLQEVTSSASKQFKIVGKKMNSVAVDQRETRGGNPFQDFFNNIGSELDKFGNYIGGEWDKLVCNISNLFKNNKKKGDDDCGSHQNSLKSRGGGAASTIQSDDRPSKHDGNMQEYICKEMKLDAEAHILVYLNIARPMLDDLAGLFNEMNMDDPTKV